MIRQPQLQDLVNFDIYKPRPEFNFEIGPTELNFNFAANSEGCDTIPMQINLRQIINNNPNLDGINHLCDALERLEVFEYKQQKIKTGVKK